MFRESAAGLRHAPARRDSPERHRRDRDAGLPRIHVRGMRIRVSDVIDLIAAGLTPAEVLDELPDLEMEDIRACLQFASSQAPRPNPAA